MLRQFGLSEVNATLCPLKGPIDTPEKMFLWRKNNINGVQLLYEFHSDSELELGERYNFVKCSSCEKLPRVCSYQYIHSLHV